MIIDNISLRYKKNKKSFQSLNLNSYRNNHHHLNDSLKKQFDTAFHELLACCDFVFPEPPIELIYTIYRRDKRRVDLANMGSVIDKYASDSLVNCGFIDDDNTDIIKCVRFVDGGIDKQHPRACLEIKRYFPETQNGAMKLKYGELENG